MLEADERVAIVDEVVGEDGDDRRDGGDGGEGGATTKEWGYGYKAPQEPLLRQQR